MLEDTWKQFMWGETYLSLCFWYLSCLVNFQIKIYSVALCNHCNYFGTCHKVVFYSLEQADKATLISKRAVQKVNRIRGQIRCQSIDVEVLNGSCLPCTVDVTQIRQEEVRKIHHPCIHTHTLACTDAQIPKEGRCPRCPAMADWLTDWQGHTDFRSVCWASLNPALAGEEEAARAYLQTHTSTQKPVEISLSVAHRDSQSNF